MLSENKTHNRLMQEKSPYLLQHAHNPVDWYPWCEEAFERARAEDKPIFLSIGYSACHWCHVMAHETFEDGETAEILNRFFISIKVDREERPDVDSVYMNVCHMFTGSGGWPLSVFMDCEKRPFYAGTYFPTKNFISLLQNITEMWRDRRKNLLERAEKVVSAVKRQKTDLGYAPLDNIWEKTAEYLKQSFDEEYGGFSDAPKFPTPHNILFLLKYYEYTKDEKCLYMCEKTLQAMAGGGIFDHVGGGFSRYSTDRFWIVPHFEKMLYDNALLLLAYSKCYKITQNKFYADVARAVANYLLRDMRHSGGGFFNAEDADSEGVEGLFYTFTEDEIRAAAVVNFELFGKYYGVSKEGNFEGRNILNTVGRQVAEQDRAMTEQVLQNLFAMRSKRQRPHRDEKIMCQNNALAIAALCNAGAILKDDSLTLAAEQAAAFIEIYLSNSDGSLVSYYLDGPSRQGGFAEDYAYYVFALTELYKITGKQNYLYRAVKVQNIFTENFYDRLYGGFFLSDERFEKVLTRQKEIYDGAVPSYNSVSLSNLLNLYIFTGDSEYIKMLAKTAACFSKDIAKFPTGYVYAVYALQKLQNKLPEIQICTDKMCYPTAKSIDGLINMFIQK